jgi:hypothetical protein
LPSQLAKPPQISRSGLCAPELREQHRDELVPAREPARVPLRPRIDHGLLKLGARKKLEQLIEDAAESRHRGWPPR